MNGKTRLWIVGVAGCLFLAAGTVLAEKGGKGGGGGGGGGNSGIALDVTISDGFAVLSDGGGPYSRGVDMVGATAVDGGGFRFDTDGTDKIIHKNQVRYVVFVFPNPDPIKFSAVPAFPPGAEPGVDVRIHNATDELGNWEGIGSLDLVGMAPGDTANAALTINFGFENSAGDTEKWQLTYGTPPPGTAEATGWGSPVTVEAGDDTNDDGSPDSWTISGNLAGMRHQSPHAKKWDVYDGEDFMAFQMVLERQ